MSERLNTAKDILLKNKRKAEIRFSGPHEEIFNVGFYVGMLAFSDFMEEISHLPEDLAVEEAREMVNEVNRYFDNFPNHDQD